MIDRSYEIYEASGDDDGRPVASRGSPRAFVPAGTDDGDDASSRRRRRRLGSDDDPSFERRLRLPLEELLSDSRRDALRFDMEILAREADLREERIRAKLSELGRLHRSAASSYGNAVGMERPAAGGGGDDAFDAGSAHQTSSLLPAKIDFEMRRERSSAAIAAPSADRNGVGEATMTNREQKLLALLGVKRAYALDEEEDWSAVAAFTSSGGLGDNAGGERSKGAAKLKGTDNLYVQYDGPTKKKTPSQPARAASEPKVAYEDTWPPSVRRGSGTRRVPTRKDLPVVMERIPQWTEEAPSSPSPPPPDMKVKLERSTPERADPPPAADATDRADPPPAVDASVRESTDVAPTSGVAAAKSTPAEVPKIERPAEETKAGGPGNKRMERESIRPETLEYIKGSFVLASPAKFHVAMHGIFVADRICEFDFPPPTPPPRARAAGYNAQKNAAEMRSPATNGAATITKVAKTDSKLSASRSDRPPTAGGDPTTAAATTAKVARAEETDSKPPASRSDRPPAAAAATTAKVAKAEKTDAKPPAARSDRPLAVGAGDPMAAMAGAVNNVKTFSVGVAVGSVALITRQRRKESSSMASSSPSQPPVAAFHHFDTEGAPPDRPTYEDAIDADAVEDAGAAPPGRRSYLDSLSSPVVEDAAGTGGASYLNTLDAGATPRAAGGPGPSASLGAASPSFGAAPLAEEIDGSGGSPSGASSSDGTALGFVRPSRTSSQLDMASSPAEVVLDEPDRKRRRRIRVFVENSVQVTAQSPGMRTEAVSHRSSGTISAAEFTHEVPNRLRSELRNAASL